MKRSNGVENVIKQIKVGKKADKIWEKMGEERDALAVREFIYSDR